MSARIRIPVITFLALTLFWAAGFIGFSVHVKGIPAPTPSKTDAIIVLTGGPDRINTGLDLLSEKQARYLFISGVNTKVSVDQLVSMWRENVRRAPCCIVLGHEAQNTFENAEEAKDWIEANNVQSARLLTANYHMPRAQLEFRALMPQMDIHIHPVKSKKANWWLLANEYNKILYTLLRVKLTSNSS